MRRRVAIVALGLAATHASAETISLSGTVLSQLVGGRTVNIDTPVGTQLPINYRADGTLTGSAGSLAFYLGSARDTGRWWIKGDKVCQKWKHWFDGDITCLRIRHQGRRVYWQSDDGKSGTGTLVGPTPEEVAAQKERARMAAIAAALASPVVPRLLSGPVLVREGRIQAGLLTLAMFRSAAAVPPSARRADTLVTGAETWCRATLAANVAAAGSVGTHGGETGEGPTLWFTPIADADPAAAAAIRFGCLSSEPALVAVARAAIGDSVR